MLKYILLVRVFLSSVYVIVFPVDESLAQQNLDITKGNSTVWLGGEKIGTQYKIRGYGGPNVAGGLVNITSQLNISPQTEEFSRVSCWIQYSILTTI
jgi:hypothetical protein